MTHHGHQGHHGHHSHHGHNGHHGYQITNGYGQAENRLSQPSAYAPIQPQHSVYVEVHKHHQREHIAEMAAVGAGAFAAYEAHQVKVDPIHAERHRREEKIAGAAAVGLAGYALHERHQAHKLEASLGHHEKHHKDKHHHRIFK